MKFIRRGRCSVAVLCPAESLPVTYSSHHPSMVMSSPPAKTVNTILLVTHDFVFASILKKCFLKTSHARLLANKIVQRKPSELVSKKMQEKKRRKTRRGEKPMHVFLQGPGPPYSIRLCRSFPAAPSCSWHIREKMNTAKAGAVSQEFKIWAALT